MHGLRHVLAMTVLAGVLAGSAAEAAKFKVLHSFCESKHRVCGDGSNPQGPLVMDQAGNFFGTTATGGLDAGTVFELERKQGGGYNLKTLYRFCSQHTCGFNPSGALVIDTAGNLYGTANNLVYELSPGGKRGLWTEKVLHGFCGGCGDGVDPLGGLTYAGASSGAPYDGVSPLFGVTQGGGANNGGTVFQLTNNSGSWSESVLYSFCSQGGDKCTDGKEPAGGVILSESGHLFGTAQRGGENDWGTVFELAPDGDSWTRTTLYSFCTAVNCSDGLAPVGELVMDQAGNLLGAAEGGGGACKPEPLGCGVVFKLVPNGVNSQLTVLYAFCSEGDCRDGRFPISGLFLDSSGGIFGSTWFGGGNDIDVNGFGGGVVFQLSGSSYRVLHRFCSQTDCADGEYPQTRPAMDAFLELLGTTSLGGAFGDDIFGGTVFRLRP